VPDVRQGGLIQLTPATARGELPVIQAPVAREERARLVRRARLLAWGGNAWHFVEFGIALAAGIAAGSIALIGFGFDSLIESLAGFIILWRFGARRAHLESAERRAQQLIAVSYFVLAAYVGVESVRTLLGGGHPETSWVGIGLAAVTAPTMPLLARAKQRVGRRLNSSATVSEGSQNMICAYLSVALLVGLGANAFFGWWWADPAAALVIAAVALREGIESWRGDSCCDVC
jgi:divalent metal cation (Fe/Co/Zn/Cd) transporter